MISLRQNPIFRREFTTAARGSKLLWALIVLIAILSLILFMLWPRTGVFSRFDSNELFMVFLASNLGLLLFTAPVVAATAVTEEKERNTFDQLFTTLLTPFDIMAGKLFSAFAMILLIIFVTMPITAICALSGGISTVFLLKTYGIITLALLTYSLMGLALSAWCRHSYAAVLLTYLGIIVLAGAVWLPAVLLRQFEPLREAVLIMRTLSPFEALAALYDPVQYQVSWGGIDPQQAVFQHLIGMTGLAVIFLIAFCFLIFRPPAARRKETSQPLYNDFRTGLKRRLGFPFYLIDPLKRKKPIGFLRNPVFVVELRSKIFGNPKFILRALAACIAISLCLIFLVTLQYGVIFTQDQVRLTAVLFQFGVVAAFAPVVSSSSVTDEMTSGTFEMLRMTPLYAWTLVTGKFKAAFIYVLVFLISSVPVFFAIMYMETDPAYWRVGAWMAVLVLATLTFTMFGLFASSIMKNTAATTALSYGFAFILSIGTLTVLMFGDRISQEVQAAVLSLNPLIAALQLTTEQWFGDYPLIFNNQIWQNTLLVYTAIFVIILFFTAIRVHTLFSRRN